MKKPKILKMPSRLENASANRKPRGKPFVKGDQRAGRPKGSKNRVPLIFKQALLEALAEAGGVEYLKCVAKDHPCEFLAVCGRLLPSESKVDLSTGQTFNVIGIPIPLSDEEERALEELRNRTPPQINDTPGDR
jgi:hypothetical protein